MKHGTCRVCLYISFKLQEAIEAVSQQKKFKKTVAVLGTSCSDILPGTARS